MGPETKPDSAGEDRQSFARSTDPSVRSVRQKNMVMSPMGLGTNNECASEARSNLPETEVGRSRVGSCSSWLVVRAEVEDSPLLEAATKQRLVTFCPTCIKYSVRNGRKVGD
jgi:hypothetical protein